MEKKDKRIRKRQEYLRNNHLVFEGMILQRTWEKIFLGRVNNLWIFSNFSQSHVKYFVSLSLSWFTYLYFCFYFVWEVKYSYNFHYMICRPRVCPLGNSYSISFPLNSLRLQFTFYSILCFQPLSPKYIALCLTHRKYSTLK